MGESVLKRPQSIALFLCRCSDKAEFSGNRVKFPDQSHANSELEMMNTPTFAFAKIFV